MSWTRCGRYVLVSAAALTVGFLRSDERTLSSTQVEAILDELRQIKALLTNQSNGDPEAIHMSETRNRRHAFQPAARPPARESYGALPISRDSGP